MGCNCSEEGVSWNDAIISMTRGIKSIARSVVTDYQPFVDKETQDARLEICRSCEHYATTLNKPRCGVCGCFLTYKTYLKDQSCPHHDGAKWTESK